MEMSFKELLKTTLQEKEVEFITSIYGYNSIVSIPIDIKVVNISSLFAATGEKKWEEINFTFDSADIMVDEDLGRRDQMLLHFLKPEIQAFVFEILLLE